MVPQKHPVTLFIHRDAILLCKNYFLDEQFIKNTHFDSIEMLYFHRYLNIFLFWFELVKKMRNDIDSVHFSRLGTCLIANLSLEGVIMNTSFKKSR